MPPSVAISTPFERSASSYQSRLRALPGTKPSKAFMYAESPANPDRMSIMTEMMDRLTAVFVGIAAVDFGQPRTVLLLLPNHEVPSGQCARRLPGCDEHERIRSRLVRHSSVRVDIRGVDRAARDPNCFRCVLFSRRDGGTSYGHIAGIRRKFDAIGCEQGGERFAVAGLQGIQEFCIPCIDGPAQRCDRR